MDWFMAVVVGAAGGASMEAVDVIKAIKWHRQMPWKVQSDTIDPPQRSADVRPGEEHLPHLVGRRIASPGCCGCSSAEP
ncbi:hypothetical protein [Streptomyces lydicus]|uniref:hypothetical protein n=1 Tax=Streptomyces lydicus TaxID=47763 RepID=UPI0036EB9217